jgi:CTP synthase
VEATEFKVEDVEDCDGILVPGGFGVRGVRGKLEAIRYARERNVPFLGICLGFQLAVIEYARNVKGLEVHSQEFDEHCEPAVVFMPDTSTTHYGGTMRLGSHAVYLESKSLMHKLYQQSVILERHRHRYEVNPAYRDRIADDELRFTGFDETGERTEALELSSHPFFLATQFHPEFKSRRGRPSPVFQEFVGAMVRSREQDR